MLGIIDGGVNRGIRRRDTFDIKSMDDCAMFYTNTVTVIGRGGMYLLYRSPIGVYGRMVI